MRQVHACIVPYWVVWGELHSVPVRRVVRVVLGYGPFADPGRGT